MSVEARWAVGLAEQTSPGRHGAWTRRAGRRSTTPSARTVLRVLVCLVVATAPLEGYLADIAPDLPKLPAAVLVVAWFTWRLRVRRCPASGVGVVELAALATIVLASTAVHLDMPAAVPAAVRWLSFLLITYVLLDLFSTVVDPREAAVAFAVGALIAGVAATASFVLSAGPDPRASGPIGDPNDLAFTLVAAMPFVLLPGLERGSAGRVGVWADAARALSLLILIMGTALTFSRGAALGLATGALIVVVCRPRLVRARMLALLGVISLLGAIALGATSSVELTTAFRGKAYVADANVAARTDRWAAATEMIGHSPVLGVGPGGFRSEYDRALDATEPSPTAGVAHQLYLETGAELGAAGLGILLLLCARAIVATELRRRRDGESGFPIALHAGLGAVLVTSFFLSEQYYLPLWLMIAMGLSLASGDRPVPERWR